MGFRSTLVSEHIQYKRPLPEWFIEKYKDVLHFGENNGLPISTKLEVKAYGKCAELANDLQKVLGEWKEVSEIQFVWLHECDGVTKVIVRPDSIRYLEPREWSAVSDITHDYCYGCSDIAEQEGQAEYE